MDCGDSGNNVGSSSDLVLNEEVPNRSTKVLRSLSKKEFATAKLHRTFEQHVRQAQNAFLCGDTIQAEREATLALRLRPTAHLFALLAVVAESRGQFDRASDFRLLQAFLARDAALWEELLHEFLDQQLYYKSVVCLQRLSALERKDAQRYRALQLQLADLLVGLGEIRRATHVLEPLWSSSRYRDFEVFALLSSLYFQLGKWSRLQRLIETSVKHAFHVSLRAAEERDNNNNSPARPDASAHIHHDGEEAIQTAVTDAHTCTHVPRTTEESGYTCTGHSTPHSNRHDKHNDKSQERDKKAVDHVCDTDERLTSAPSHHLLAVGGGAGDDGAPMAQTKRPVPDSSATRTRVSRRVRFFGMDDDDDSNSSAKADPSELPHAAPAHSVEGSVHTRRTAVHAAHSAAPSRPAAILPGDSNTVAHTALDARNESADKDDFDFDELTATTHTTKSNTDDNYNQDETRRCTGEIDRSVAAPLTSATPVIYDMYGGLPVRLHRSRDRRNFLTLVNVHAELLNERGQFAETVRLLEHAAACVQVRLLELPPDLLVRLGMAYAFLGHAEQPCREVFRSLRENCPMDSYADVLLDAAVGLCKVGMHRDALEMFHTIGQYHRFCYDRLESACEEDRQALFSSAAGATAKKMPATHNRTAHTHASSSVPVSAQERRTHTMAPTTAADKEEAAALRVILAASYAGQAECYYALEQLEACEEALHHTLHYDPTHLAARLLLGKLRYYHRGGDVAGAVRALTPREDEPALQRIQLGHALVHIYRHAGHYLAAIALGVVIFELLVQSAEADSGGVGDTDSVAAGHRSAGGGGSAARSALLLPTMSRASSAIVPASSLLDWTAGTTTATRSAMSSRVGPPASSLRQALAASIRTSSVVYRQQRARQGRGALLTTTLYGASAAASVAAGAARHATASRSAPYSARSRQSRASAETNEDEEDDEEDEGQKDRSAIFRFHRRRRRRSLRERKSSVTPRSASDAAEESPRRVRRRVEEGGCEDRTCATPLVTMPASAFWSEGKMGEEEEEEEEEYAKESDAHVTRDDVARACEESVVEHQKQRQEQQQQSHKQKQQEKQLSDTASTTAARDDDLAELEEFERVTSNGSTTNEHEHEHDKEDATNEAETLPSLEDISRQFDDPVMASLFLHAYDITPNLTTAAQDNMNSAAIHTRQDEEDRAAAAPAAAAVNSAFDTPHTTDPRGSTLCAAQLTSASHTPHAPLTTLVPPTTSYTVAAVRDRVTVKEVVAALGRRALIDLAVTLVDCYAALDRFSEAKEFAFLTLTSFGQKMSLRQVARSLEQPLRLAVLRAALASGQSEDAYRVGLRLLYDAGTPEERSTVVTLLHGVLNRCEDRSSIVYRHILDGHRDVALLVLLANRYYQTRSFTRVLNLYLLAHRQRPMDIFLNFMVGLSFYLCSHQKKTREREACVSAGTVYFARYQTLLSASDPRRTGEALYNCARVLHYLHLHYLCIPLYERVATQLCVPEECTRALQRAARVNLYFIYRWVTGNHTLALSVLPQVT